jgi:hypothetical protein
MAFAPQRVMIYVVRVVTVRHLEMFPGEGSSEEWEMEREARLCAASLLLCQREVSWWGGRYEGDGAYRVKEWEKVLLKNFRFLWGPSLSDKMSVAKRSYVSCALLIQQGLQGLYKSSNNL